MADISPSEFRKDLHSTRSTFVPFPSTAGRWGSTCIGLSKPCIAIWSGFSFSSRRHHSIRKDPYTLHPVSQQSLQGCPRNSASICLVEHRLFSTVEGGISTASFLHSSILQVINTVMRWPVHVQKIPQASEHLCPAKLQTRCDICCACQSIWSRNWNRNWTVYLSWGDAWCNGLG